MGASGWFAAGYAHTAHGLPLTERARIAHLAACAVWEAAPDPGPTLQLGELEGVWAVVYARREAIEKLHGKALQAVLDAIAALDWDTVTARIASYALDTSISRAEMGVRLRRDVLDLITNGLPHDINQQWRSLIVDAVTDGTAEGQTAGLALVADAGSMQIAWDLTAAEAKAALAGNTVLWDTSSQWMERQASGIAYQISQRLATMWADGATAADMETEIADLLDVSRSTAAVILDQAIGQALAVGAVQTYDQAGVAYVDFVTAGDSRVCEQCELAETQGPYALYDAPSPPLHPGCRCTVAPSDYQLTSAGLALVNTYLSDDLEAA